MNSSVLASQAEQFREIFGIRLAQFWLGPLRLDIVKFDEEVVHPRAGESTAQAVERRWGKDALDLVRVLL
jgi:hypothetical protein